MLIGLVSGPSLPIDLGGTSPVVLQLVCGNAAALVRTIQSAVQQLFIYKRVLLCVCFAYMYVTLSEIELHVTYMYLVAGGVGRDSMEASPCNSNGDLSTLVVGLWVAGGMFC